MMTLPACRTVLGTDTAYELAHIGHRPGGATDVVVKTTPYDADLPPAYLAYRRGGVSCPWRALAGDCRSLGEAVAHAARATRYATRTAPELDAVLALVEAGVSWT